MPEKNLFAITGDDDLEKNETLERLLKKWLQDLYSDPLAKETYYADDCNIDKVRESYETVSMFASQKALIIKNVDKAPAEFQKNLSRMLKHPDDRTAVILVMEQMARDSPLLEIIKTSAISHNHKIPFSNKIPQWLVGRCKAKYKRAISLHDAAFLQDSIGDNLQELDGELRKLHTFLLPGKAIAYADIKEVTLPHRDANIFELQKDLGLADKSRFLVALSNLLDQGQPPFLLAMGLFRHFLKLLKIRRCIDNGDTAEQVAEAFKMHAFVFQKNQIYAQATGRPLVLMKKILRKLADLELNFKKGNFPRKFEAEMAFAELFQLTAGNT